MIPVNPAGMLVAFLLLLLSLQCLLALTVGLVALCIPRRRAYFWSLRRRFIPLAVLLLLGSLPMLSLFYQWFEDWQQSQALNPTLKQPQTLGDLHLPAGTNVWLQRLAPLSDLSGNPLPYGLASLKRAEFKRTPGQILGMQVSRLELDGARGLADLAIAAPAWIEGWQCSPQSEVHMVYPFNAPFVFADWRLGRCTLAAGSQAGGIQWPDAVTLNAIGKDGWQLQADESQTPIRLGRMSVLALRLVLDSEHREVVSWSAQLAQALQLQGMEYPAGTVVKGRQGRLVFAANDKAPAKDLTTGNAVPARQAVAHDEATGKRLGIYPISQVGIYPLEVSDDYE